MQGSPAMYARRDRKWVTLMLVRLFVLKTVCPEESSQWCTIKTPPLKLWRPLDTGSQCMCNDSLLEASQHLSKSDPFFPFSRPNHTQAVRRCAAICSLSLSPRLLPTRSARITARLVARSMRAVQQSKRWPVMIMMQKLPLGAFPGTHHSTHRRYN